MQYMQQARPTHKQACSRTHLIMLLAKITQSSNHIHQVGIALHVRTGTSPFCVTALGLVLTEPLCQLADATATHAWSCLWCSKTLQQIVAYNTLSYNMYLVYIVLHLVYTTENAVLDIGIPCVCQQVCNLRRHHTLNCKCPGKRYQCEYDQAYKAATWAL